MGAFSLEKAQAFAKKLKELRGIAGLSQSRLAEASGFDHSYVSRLESGNRVPTRDAVEKLSEALRLNDGQLDSLLASAGFMPQRIESLFADEPVLSDVLSILQSQEIPEPVRANVRQMLEVMVHQARLAAEGHPITSASGLDSLVAD